MALTKKTSIGIALAIVILGIAGYVFWMQPGADSTISVTGVGPTTEAQTTFLTLAGQLETVAFDQTILSDPRFTALIDIKTAIIPENEGRSDPFAPLPGVRP